MSGVREDMATALLEQMGQRVPSELVEFGRALETFFVVSVSFDWPYFLEKPYKWATEYVAWANLDYPQEDDPEWDAFSDAMEALVNAT